MWIFRMLVLAHALLCASVALADVKTSTPSKPAVAATVIVTPQAVSSTVTAPHFSAAKLLSKLKCNHGAGICPSVPLVASSLGLDGQFHALNIGAGFGLDVPFTVADIDLSIGLAIAPVIEVDHQVQQGIFGVLAHLDVYAGGGAGLLWRAFEVGGADPGLHPFHRSQLFLVLTLDLIQVL